LATVLGRIFWIIFCIIQLKKDPSIRDTLTHQGICEAKVSETTCFLQLLTGGYEAFINPLPEGAERVKPKKKSL
jgi:hypothetical protein